MNKAVILVDIPDDYEECPANVVKKCGCPLDDMSKCEIKDCPLILGEEE